MIENMRGIFILAEIPPEYKYTLKNKGSKGFTEV